MNIRKVFALKNKAEKEAQKAIDAIYRKYNSEINSLIAEAIGRGHVLESINGMARLIDSNGNKVDSGKAWGIISGNEQLCKLSHLQYKTEHLGGFLIKGEIKGVTRYNK